MKKFKKLVLNHLVTAQLQAEAARKALSAKLADTSGNFWTDNAMGIAVGAALAGITLVILTTIFKEDISNGLKSAIGEFFKTT